MNEDDQKALRRIRREEVLADLREGRRQRATTFRPKKGRGSYRRKEKYGGV